MQERRKLTRVGAIKEFFESNGGRKVENREVMALTTDERHEIGDACLAAIGADLQETK